jgi:redox-sensitive bicupin YhaK (pirin superfamily)
MTENKNQENDQSRPEQEGDVEGHNLWLNPSASREMTSSRTRDIEREARERQRAKEAKGNRR